MLGTVRLGREGRQDAVWLLQGVQKMYKVEGRESESVQETCKPGSEQTSPLRSAAQSATERPDQTLLVVDQDKGDMEAPSSSSV